jgi:multidrug efflux system outer membrane protein
MRAAKGFSGMNSGLPWRRLIALAAAALLAGCASQPRPAPDLRLPSAYEARPADAVVALERWWTTFEDPQLSALIDQALAANPDAKSAAARLREAEGTRSGALTRFLPQGNVSASTQRTDTRQIEGGIDLGPGVVIPGLSLGGITDTDSASFKVSWEIDLFGRLFAAKRTADADLLASVYDAESTRASLAAQVADACFQARGLSIQLADARETARIQGELYRVAGVRAKAGLAASSEPDRVAGDLAQSEAQIVALEAELQVQRRTLLILTGRSFESTDALAVQAFVGAAPQVPASLPSDLLRRRPDVRKAEAQLAGALGRQELARLAFLPTFNLLPGVGWSRSVQSGSPTESSNWSLGVGVTVPVLDIPNLLSQLRVSRARGEQAVYAYEKAVQTALGEAESALVHLDADRRRVTLLSDGEARAERAYKAAQMGYQRGLTDLQTTLSSEQSWRATRTQLTSAQVQAVRRAVQAYKAIGGGWPGAAKPAMDQDVAKVNP